MKDIDAVIAALRQVMHYLEHSNANVVSSQQFNRWIHQLPGPHRQWRHFILEETNPYRVELVVHGRAVMAYLETHRDVIKAQQENWSVRRLKLFWPFKSSTNNSVADPVDAVFEEVSDSEKASDIIRIVKK